jgi:hypothetical protein
MDVWRVPLNANGAKEAEPERLVASMGEISAPTISWDGTRIAYSTRLAHGLAIRIHNSITGDDYTAHTVSAPDTGRPALSGDGRIVAYSDIKKGYITHIPGSDTEVFCDRCSPPTHISVDGRQILVEDFSDDDQIQICSNPGGCRPLIPWAGGKKFLKQAGARFSPDGRWVVFSGWKFDSPDRHIWITPVRESGTVSENDLIQITDGPATESEPVWSPDGRTIFYLSDQDNFRCVYGQHMNPETAQPTGSVFAVFHAHKADRFIGSPTGQSGDIGLSASRDSLVLMMTTRQGNIWLRKEQAPRR